MRLLMAQRQTDDWPADLAFAPGGELCRDNLEMPSRTGCAGWLAKTVRGNARKVVLHCRVDTGPAGKFLARLGDVQVQRLKAWLNAPISE
jgi:hypothetical protein